MLDSRAFAVVVTCLLAACGNDGTDTGDPGAGGSLAGTGGSEQGGAPSSGGTAPSSGGAPATCSPGTSVVCPCAGGSQGTATCDASGKPGACACAPAGTYGDCFTHSAGFDTCSVYCKSKGRTCLAQGCSGFTWESYPAARAAECGTDAYPAQFGPDTCTTPIWLSAAKPLDDVVRCCCQ